MSDRRDSRADLNEEIENLRRKVAELSAIERELKDTIRRLRSGEEQYRALLRTYPMAVAVTDLQGKITHTSDMALKLHGYESAEEILGMSAFDFFAPEDRERAAGNLRRTLEEGIVEDLQYTLLKKDGSSFLAELSSSVVFDAEGTPYAFIATVSDVTERKQMENALRASEEKYRDLAENINDAIYTVSGDGTLEYVSPAIEAMIGYRPSELIGRKFTRLILSEDEGRAVEGLKNVMKGQVRPNEVRARTRSGEIRWLRASSRPVYSGGKVVGIQGVLTDITERKKAEIKAEFLSMITERLRDSVIVTDADFKIHYVNKAAERMFGYSAKEMIDRSPEMLSAEPRTAELMDQMIRTVTSGKAWDGSMQCIRKDRTTFISDLRISPLPDEKGFATHFVAVQRDVTDKRRLEQELLQAQKMEAVGTMAGGIAHEFNNVLTAIIGYSELLLTDSTPGSEMHKDVVEIGKTARRAAALTRQLLSFSRRQVMQVAQVDLNTVVYGLDRMLRRVAGEAVRLVFELDPGLKRVEADAGRIEQVIMNLVVNARDAMPEGGALTIRTENVLMDDASCRGKPEARPGEWVRLEVADTGEGMDSEIMAHVFEPFYTTKEVGQGSGLGLSVVFGIVRQHGGWMDLTSVPGEGCSFSVYLPVAEDVPSSAVERDAGMPDRRGHGERILLVEDEGVVREMAERALSGRGYTVFSAKNVAEAREVFESERVRFDLVFSDVVLPDGSGFDLAERLNSFDPELRVLLTSGYADRELTGSTIEDRGYSFLEKPYELADLLRAVGKALSQSRKKWEEGS